MAGPHGRKTAVRASHNRKTATPQAPPAAPAAATTEGMRLEKDRSAGFWVFLEQGRAPYTMTRLTELGVTNGDFRFIRHPDGPRAAGPDNNRFYVERRLSDDFLIFLPN